MLYPYRFIIIGTLIAIVAGVTGYTYYSYVNSFQLLTVTYSQKESPLTLYANPEDENSSPKEIQTVTSGEEMKLKKGNYTLRAKGKMIADYEKSISLKDEPISTSVAYQYSENYLASLLLSEQIKISKVLLSAYPKLPNLYDQSRQKLYGRGDFYGEILTYKGDDSDNRDTLRVLMQKKNGKWIVITKPPQINLSIEEYPFVPKSALIDINQLATLPEAPNSPAINPNTISPFE